MKCAALAVDQAVETILTAADRVGESALARVASVDHTSVRGLREAHWNPTRRTLRALEGAARAILAEPAQPCAERVV